MPHGPNPAALAGTGEAGVGSGGLVLVPASPTGQQEQRVGSRVLCPGDGCISVPQHHLGTARWVRDPVGRGGRHIGTTSRPPSPDPHPGSSRRTLTPELRLQRWGIGPSLWFRPLAAVARRRSGPGQAGGSA